VKKNFLYGFLFFVLIFSFTGCAALETARGRVGVTAYGAPATLSNLFSDVATFGAPKTTPGGFTVRNSDPTLGVIINADDGVSVDVDIYVRKAVAYTDSRGRKRTRRKWVLYGGPAVVLTPGYVKEFENGEWVEVDTPRWLKVRGLESIHFDSPFLQNVTLRLRRKGGEAVEVKFSTSGREYSGGGYYKRVNALFIKLPPGLYRLEVYKYTGKGIFRSVRGYPSTHYIRVDSDPVEYRIGNTWVGWKERL